MVRATAALAAPPPGAEADAEAEAELCAGADHFPPAIARRSLRGYGSILSSGPTPDRESGAFSETPVTICC